MSLPLTIASEKMLGRSISPLIAFGSVKKALLKHPWVCNNEAVIGSRLHLIENLALSLHFITFNSPGIKIYLMWNTFRWDELPRFMSLKRIDVVLAVRGVDENHYGSTKESSLNDQGKVMERRLEAWTCDSSMDNADYITTTLLDNVKTSVDEPFEEVYRNGNESLCRPEGAAED
jgi:hypothetical protein